MNDKFVCHTHPQNVTTYWIRRRNEIKKNIIALGVTHTHTDTHMFLRSFSLCRDARQFFFD